MLSSNPLPVANRKTDVDEARAGNVDISDFRVLLELFGNDLAKRPRVEAEWLGQHHGRIGGNIAVGGIAWRFYRDTREIQSVTLFANDIDLLKAPLVIRNPKSVKRFIVSSTSFGRMARLAGIFRQARAMLLP